MLAAGLVRTRLLRRVSEADVAMIVAPAGSGKTHLLQQHAARCGVGVAWLRADPDDAEPGRFHARLREIAGEAATVIVDDFHFVVGSPAEEEMERFVLRRRPDGPRLVLGSRVRPSMNLMRAEIGAVTVLSGDDLRFRSWEVEELFAEVYGCPLPPRDAAALSRYTDGWAAGLHLFHLGTQALGASRRREAIDALSGRSRYLSGYLAQTVLGELPPELREFLRRTYVFEVLTAERCNGLLERDDAASVLAELERRQALTSSDDGGRTFRYHEVLRRHLATALREELGAEGAARWCERAAAQLEAERAYAEAARLFARAERWAEVARLLYAHGASVVGDPHGPVWSAALPGSVVDQDPWLSLATARREVATGNLVRGALFYRRAEGLFAEPEQRDATARERRLVDIWLDASPRPRLHWLDRLRAATLRRPLAHLGGEFGSAGDLLTDACVLLLAGRVEEAARRLSWSPEEPADPTLELWVEFVAVVVGMLRGRIGAPRVERLAWDAERAGVTALTRQCRALAALGAAGEPAEVVGECEAVGDRWGAALASGIAACRALLAGRPSAGQWHAVVQRCVELRADTVTAWALALEALARALDGTAESDDLPARAEAAARAAWVPGARCVALLAAAVQFEGRGAGPLAAARTVAADIGMPLPQRLLARVEEGPVPPVDVLIEEPVAVRPEMSVLGAGVPAPVVAAAVVEAIAVAKVEVAVRDSTASVLRLRCLGEFAVEIDGARLDAGSLRPRAATTLRFLSVRAGRWVHRDDLLAALWPDLSRAQARQNLQVTVSTVRKFLEPDIGRGKSRLLVRQGETYSIALVDGGAADVVTFEAELERARAAARLGDEHGAHRALTAALAEYRGDLLPADGGAEWVVADRDRLRTRASLAAVALAECDLRHARVTEAIEMCERGLAIDPYLDRAWRLLISACHRAGDRAAAARAERDYAAMLDELGIAADLTDRAGPARNRHGPDTSAPRSARSGNG